MDFEGTAGLRRRSDVQYYMDIDTDFMAFFERTDNGSNGSGIISNPEVEAGREFEYAEAERLSGIIKSLEEEISVKKSEEGDHRVLVDNTYSSEADHSARRGDLLECLGIGDRSHGYADHGFNAMDSVEEMNMGLNYQYPFMDEDPIPIYSGAVEVDSYYSYLPGSMAVADGYGDAGEFFDESLWENTIG